MIKYTCKILLLAAVAVAIAAALSAPDDPPRKTLDKLGRQINSAGQSGAKIAAENLERLVPVSAPSDQVISENVDTQAPTGSVIIIEQRTEIIIVPCDPVQKNCRTMAGEIQAAGDSSVDRDKVKQKIDEAVQSEVLDALYDDDLEEIQPVDWQAEQNIK